MPIVGSFSTNEHCGASEGTTVSPRSATPEHRPGNSVDQTDEKEIAFLAPVAAVRRD